MQPQHNIINEGTYSVISSNINYKTKEVKWYAQSTLRKTLAITIKLVATTVTINVIIAKQGKY